MPLVRSIKCMDETERWGNSQAQGEILSTLATNNANRSWSCAWTSLRPCSPQIESALVQENKVLVNANGCHPRGEGVAIVFDISNVPRCRYSPKQLQSNQGSIQIPRNRGGGNRGMREKVKEPRLHLVECSCRLKICLAAPPLGSSCLLPVRTNVAMMPFAVLRLMPRDAAKWRKSPSLS